MREFFAVRDRKTGKYLSSGGKYSVGLTSLEYAKLWSTSGPAKRAITEKKKYYDQVLASAALYGNPNAYLPWDYDFEIVTFELKEKP